jgi:phage shock protein A
MNSTNDEDLRGLDLQSAKEFIVAYSIDAKRIEKEIAEAQDEIGKWKARAALVDAKLAAGDQSVAPLIEAARARLAELSAKASSLETERADLRARIDSMRAQLPIIKASERSIDPDRLLAELQMMTGELLGDAIPGGSDLTGSSDAGQGMSAAQAEAEIAKLESQAKVDSALEELKKRASEGQQ